MKLIEISDIEDVKKQIERSGYKIFGIGGFPSTRSEIWPFVPNYEVICANDTGELESVQKNVEITVFTKKKKPIPYPIKRPITLLSDNKVASFIRKKSLGKKIAIYVYQPTLELENLCKKNKWLLIANKAKKYYSLDDRKKFYDILKEIGVKRKIILVKANDIPNKMPSIFKKLGNKIVVQLLDEGGGRGTLFFEKKDEPDIPRLIDERLSLIKKSGKNPLLSISPYIEGAAISMTGCITRTNGILSSYCQYQLIDIPETTRNKRDAFGIFCGHDWSLSDEIPQKIHQRARKITEKIGTLLKKQKVYGIFGVDFIWNKNTNDFVPLEVNLRLLGTFPTAIHVQIEKNEVPLAAFHVLEFLKIPYKIKERIVYRKDARRKGAHLLLFNPFNHDAVCQRELKGGVYSIAKGKIRFIRLGSSLQDILEDSEFILTEGVPKKDLTYRKNGKLLKIIAKGPLSRQGGKQLNSFGKKIVKSIYKELEMKPYEKK